ncbi:hypothetical protein GCM10009617_30990 [Leifsonia poae]|uniref:GmrSD restriction endonucleases C-terminal domain-containing protein n=1 Tax=Leifsonia poae TaxID=110933 RepID=A0A9W6HAK2_9MICO|nr:hypothetical protein GCM10017584_18870 [Leifsonia poae]
MPSRRRSSKARALAGWLSFAVLAVVVVGAASSGLVGAPTADPGTADPATSAPATSAPASTDSATSVPTPTPTSPDAPAAGGTALALLQTLPVKGRAPKTGYDRVGRFGTAWTDVDRNGCDTRNDILARDLRPAVRSGSCRVTSGTLHDPYTGRTIAFVRGSTTSVAVQIDHVVALMDAWQTGAQQLTQSRRIALANDPLNLLAVDGPTNEQKSDGDAATWLPPSTGYRCAYVARQVSVKAAYGLWVTQAERDAIARVLARCPSQPALGR